MDWVQLFSSFLTTLLAMGGALAWLWGRIDKKFEAIDKKFEAIDKKFEAILSEIKEIKEDLRKIDVRLSRLETQDEERFRNEIKLIVREKAGK